MSSRNNTRAAPKKSFCKVCFDAGKSEEMYMSHFVRASPDPNSQVCCPTLLGQSCRRCGKKGHTVSRCTVIVRDNTCEKEIVPKKMVVQKIAAKNAFDALAECSDSEDDVQIKSKVYPSPQIIRASAPPASVWMDTAKRNNMTKALLSALHTPPAAAVKADDKMMTLFRFKNNAGKSWADYESDCDDE